MDSSQARTRLDSLVVAKLKKNKECQEKIGCQQWQLRKMQRKEKWCQQCISGQCPRKEKLNLDDVNIISGKLSAPLHPDPIMLHVLLPRKITIRSGQV